jgi:hypothetical protein
MNVENMTLDEIRVIGLEILARELGPVGLVRFLQQFEIGKGDYTRERSEWLREKDVKTLAERIVRERETK